MNIILNLSGIALREVVSGAFQTVCFGKTGEAVVGYLTERFTNHSQRLTNALQTANERAWRALEVALAGDSLWEHCKTALASAEDKAFREQLRVFLEESPWKGKTDHRAILPQALQELRRARKKGALVGGSLSPTALAKEAGAFASFSDPHAILNAEWKVLERVADELRETCPYLYRILVTKINPPILAVAVRYYFRREVQRDQQLFQDLSFTIWQAGHASQERAFAALNEALSSQNQRLSEMILSMDEKIDRLEQQIQELLKLLQIKGEVKPRHSLSIRSDDERKWVQRLVEIYRSLSEEQRVGLPGLLNDLGKLKVAAGDFGGAGRDFGDAAAMLEDPKRKAEACYNAYQAALERQQWDEALKAIQQAVELDRERFAPFPFGTYKPQRILGAGGFGTVYLCRHAFLLNEVVVKALHSAELERPVADVFAEAQALIDLNHPTIIGVQHCDYADHGHTRPYIVMPYFKGTSLEQFVKHRGTLSAQQMVAVARQIAEGVKAAHARGILHRDLKPDNILVRKEGDTWHVKIIDFGLAVKVVGQADGGSSSAKSIIGQSVSGTLKYAPPEQLGEMPGIKPGPYSDVYAFGKLCCYVLFRTTAPLMSHWKSLPLDLADMLNGCLQENLEHRLKNFEQVLQALPPIEPLLKVPCPQCCAVLSLPTDFPTGKEFKCSSCKNFFIPKPPGIRFETELKEALEELRTKGDTRTYFQRQGPTRIGVWQSAAQQDAIAQWLLARCLQEGTGIQKDTQAAVSWLRRAAESGLAVAQSDLGDCYYLGAGLEADTSEAFRLYTKAAEQNFPEATANLGDCYFEGEGIAEDLAEAAHCYRKAAEAGSAYGQYKLGACYFDGSGVEQDYHQAISWYRKAAEQGQADATPLHIYWLPWEEFFVSCRRRASWRILCTDVCAPACFTLGL